MTSLDGGILLLLLTISCVSHSLPVEMMDRELGELAEKKARQESYEKENGGETPGHEYWEDLIQALPVIRSYLRRLDECLELMQELKAMERSTASSQGEDDEDQEGSHINMCRLAMLVHDSVNQDGVEQKEESSRKRAYDSIGMGPIGLKRAYDSIGMGPIGLKRAYDSIGMGPIGLKRAYDSIGMGPIGLKRAYDSIGMGPIGLKRAYDSIGMGPIGLKRSEKGDSTKSTTPAQPESRRESSELRDKLLREIAERLTRLERDAEASDKKN